MVPADDLLSYRIKFASPDVEKATFEKHKKSLKVDVVDLFAASAYNPLAASLRGRVFEACVLDVLEQGGTFAIRQVHPEVPSSATSTVKRSKNDNSQDKDLTVTIAPSTRVIVEKVDKGQNTGQLHVPESETYPAIDCWIPGTGAFQITVAKEHSFTGKVPDKLMTDLDLLGTEPKTLYWVVPEENFLTFSGLSGLSVLKGKVDQWILMVTNAQLKESASRSEVSYQWLWLSKAFRSLFY
jgi:hypothetical protein